jgi:AcrR family transcriptional regulator
MVADQAPREPGTRERVLAAALRCFLDEGYQQTTIARIRTESGVSNGALFHHFPTKEALADALYVDGIASFQQGLHEIVRRPPHSLAAAVRAVVGHQLTWTEQHPDQARFIYQRGHLDFDSPGGAEVDALNRDLAAAIRQWMTPLADRGELRPMPMLLVSAIVSGPAHAIARRWLAGQLDAPLSSYAADLALAACAALSPAPPGAELPPGPGPAIARTGRIRLEMLDAAGVVTGRGEGTIRLAPQ